MKIIKIISDFIYMIVILSSFMLANEALREGKIMPAMFILLMAGVMIGAKLTKYLYNIYFK